MSKTCLKCKLTKPLSEFTKNAITSDGKDHYCKLCLQERYKLNREKHLQKVKTWRAANAESVNNYNNTLKKRFIMWRRSSFKRGIEWNLNFENIEKIPLICHYTGENLTCVRSQPNTVSLDRVDNSKGYSPDNVVFCCARINFMKADMTPQEFSSWCKKVASYTYIS